MDLSQQVCVCVSINLSFGSDLPLKCCIRRVSVPACVFHKRRQQRQRAGPWGVSERPTRRVSVAFQSRCLRTRSTVCLRATATDSACRLRLCVRVTQCKAENLILARKRLCSCPTVSLPLPLFFLFSCSDHSAAFRKGILPLAQARPLAERQRGKHERKRERGKGGKTRERKGHFSRSSPFFRRTHKHTHIYTYIHT